jgi:FkbM family methyltransferase
MLKFILRSKLTQSFLLRAIDVYQELEYETHEPLSTRSSIDEIFSLLKPKANYSLVRFGDNKDGGYLLADCIKEFSQVFSIGVGDNTSFDEAISEIVMSVFMIDHSVDIYPKRPNITFIKKKLVPNVTDSSLEISLSELCGELDNSNPTILKMDIEGSEWAILESTEQAILQKFDQIVIEFHGFLDKVKQGQLHIIRTVLVKLLQDFEVVNTHANNYSQHQIFLNYPVVDVIEVSFLRRDLCELTNTSRESNTRNFPNNPMRYEVFLTYPQI